MSANSVENCVDEETLCLLINHINSFSKCKLKTSEKRIIRIIYDDLESYCNQLRGMCDFLLYDFFKANGKYPEQLHISDDHSENLKIEYDACCNEFKSSKNVKKYYYGRIQHFCNVIKEHINHAKLCKIDVDELAKCINLQAMKNIISKLNPSN